ncbi:hypothetical protein IT397_03585 [Candidatus Nomurabacteria bacterium]|nr:hypothetical protein [Candidatus Nomurabacteria bacterium]
MAFWNRGPKNEGPKIVPIKGRVEDAEETKKKIEELKTKKAKEDEDRETKRLKIEGTFISAADSASEELTKRVRVALVPDISKENPFTTKEKIKLTTGQELVTKEMLDRSEILMQEQKTKHPGEKITTSWVLSLIKFEIKKSILEYFKQRPNQMRTTYDPDKNTLTQILIATYPAIIKEVVTDTKQNTGRS